MTFTKMIGFKLQNTKTRKQTILNFLSLRCAFEIKTRLIILAVSNVVVQVSENLILKRYKLIVYLPFLSFHLECFLVSSQKFSHGRKLHLHLLRCILFLLYRCDEHYSRPLTRRSRGRSSYPGTHLSELLHPSHAHFKDDANSLSLHHLLHRL